MASGAGGNVVLQPWLKLNPSQVAIAGGLPGAQAGYGTIGGNDTGLILFEARGWTKWAFQMCPEGWNPSSPSPNTGALVAGYSAYVLYTIDGSAIVAQQPPRNPPFRAQDSTGSTVVPAGSWWPLPAPSDQTGTATDYNPLTNTGPILQGNRWAIGFRIVVTQISGPPTGGVWIWGGAVP